MLRYALAREFLAARDSVVLCGRCEQRLQDALAALRSEFPGAKVLPHSHTVVRACRKQRISLRDCITHLQSSALLPLDCAHLCKAHLQRAFGGTLRQSALCNIGGVAACVSAQAGRSTAHARCCLKHFPC